MHALDLFAAMLLGRLAWTSLQAIVLIAAVAAAIRWYPRLPAAARCLLWWLVGLQLLAGLAWPAPVPLRWLAPPAAAGAAPHVAAAPVAVVTQGLPLVRTMTAAATSPAAADPIATPARGHGPLAVLALWLAGLAVLLARAIRHARTAVALRRDAVPSTDADLLALCARRARELGLRRCPPLRVSARIASPQVAGPFRPAILLPRHHALAPEEIAMALDHELAHLRRGDLWAAWVPALAQALFFFHPLVTRAMREYALHREAACDAQVLRRPGSAPQAYGRLLLRLGVGHPLHAGLAGASPTFENLKRRLAMLQQIESSSRLRAWLLVALVAATGVVPYRVTAQASSEPPPATAPATASLSSKASPAALVAPSVASAPATAATPAVAAAPQTLPAPPTPPSPPPVLPPAPPSPPPALPPAPPMPPGHHSHSHVDIDTDSHARNGFALFDGDSVTMAGTSEDVARAKAVRQGDESLLWVRRGDRAYVIRDPALLARARTIYAPVTALAQEQGRLGGKQGELGGRQGGLGAQQAALGQQQAELALEQARIGGQRDAQRQTADLQARQQALQQRQDALGKQMQALDRQQQAYSHQQEALDRQQRQASDHASRQMDALIDEALAKGDAKAVAAR